MATVVQLDEWLVKRDASRIMSRAGLRPDPWQRRLLRRRPHRALATTSRQTGKSTSCAALGLHRANTWDKSVIVAVSPTQRQSTLLISKMRAFAQALGIQLIRNNQLSLALANGSEIFALPGHPDTVRGYSPDLLIIDEAAYTSDALYTACLPMLAATHGDLVAISTPNGQQGWFWNEWSGRGAEGWERIQVPYTEVSRITPEFIKSQKASMSRERFAAEYECVFNSSTFGLFNAGDLAAALQTEPITADGGTLPDPREIIARNRARFEQAAS